MLTSLSNVEDFVAQGNEAIRRKNWSEAAKYWALMREKYPNHPRGYVGGAIALKERKDFATADTLALEGLKKFPNEAELYIEYGDIAVRQANWAEAVKRWELMREKCPEHPSGFSRGSSALQHLGEFAAADALALEGLKKFPQWRWLYVEYGKSAAHQENWAEATKRWELMREKFPEEQQGYVGGVIALKEQMDFVGADSLALEGLEKFPNEQDLYIEYSDSAIRQNDWAEALKRWNLMRNKCGQSSHVELGRLGVLASCQRESVFQRITERFVLLFFDIKLENFVVELDGAVFDIQKPGFPVRMSFQIDGRDKLDYLARNNMFDVHNGLYAVKCRIQLTEKEREKTIDIFLGDCEPKTKICLEPIEENAEQDTNMDLKKLEKLIYYPDVEGRVEQADSDMVGGWAISPSHDTSSLGLMLYLDQSTNYPYAYTQTRLAREDVLQEKGGNGFSGYFFEIAPNVIPYRDLYVSVMHGEKILIGNKVISRIENFYRSRRPIKWQYSIDHNIGHLSECENIWISIIIINKNGDELLRQMFSSAVQFVNCHNIEWIVVDHNSSDNSIKYCEELKLQGFNITFYRRNANYTFSESNNYGVELAKGEIVVFANNDLVFIEDFAKELRQCFMDPKIGVLGVKLLDYASDNLQDIELLPVQHLGCFIKDNLKEKYIRCYESRLTLETADCDKTLSSVPMVTGAFLAMRREEFLAVGGFDEKYVYGLEDTDLCLKVRKYLGKEVVCANNISVVHRRGFTRMEQSSAIARRQNNEIFNLKWKRYIRREIRNSICNFGSYWLGKRPILGVIVSDADNKTSAGEYFTALELCTFIQKIEPVHVRYITKNNWYNIHGVDLLLVMVKTFNIEKIYNVNPFMITIAWIRQWFDAWCDGQDIYSYDFVFTSSEYSRNYIFEKTGITAHVLRIASNVDVFSNGHKNEMYKCDCCFTGSYFNLEREVQFCLDPLLIKGEVKIFGYNWENTNFAPYSCGPLAYSELPDVYASSKITVDDGNIATKLWGSCNSRVFDCLAGGTLLVTNNTIGVQEIFGDLVPTYHDKESLTATLNYWLEHEEERKERISILQKMVIKEHSYTVRAKEFVQVLQTKKPPIRIGIKCPAPEKEKEFWGDYYYSESLAKELRKLDCCVRVDFKEHFDDQIGNMDDVVIVLRGLSSYNVKPHQMNIVWLISHPDNVTINELQQYDYIYCASSSYAKLLEMQTGKDIEFLPQCTDTEIFRFDPTLINSRPDRNLFVGNSRGIFRDSVRWCIENDIDIDIYGSGWNSFIDKEKIKGELIPNKILGEFYASSRCVLCDHWVDMQRNGFVSNRIFDVLATGGCIITDEVEGLKEILDFDINIYRNKEEFLKLLSGDLKVDLKKRKHQAEYIKLNHSFAVRARTILAVINRDTEMSK